MLNMMVINILLCLITDNCWTNFLTESWYIMTESYGRLAYDHNVASLTILRETCILGNWRFKRSPYMR